MSQCTLFFKRTWKFIAVIAILILLYMIHKSLIGWQDGGQLIKFVWFDVLVVNSYGVLLFFMWILVIVFSIYTIVSKKAVNPKGVIFPSIVLSVIFLMLGGLLGHNVGGNLRDIGSSLTGNVKEETVVISEFSTYYSKDGQMYTYTLGDGRTFDEIYRGKSFHEVQEGGTYHIRYLPRSKKILRIESVEPIQN